VLDDDHLRTFARDGYLVVPGVVPEALLADADAEIDDLIASEPPQDGDAATPQTHGWFTPVARLPRCDAALHESGALDIANELVAPLTLDHRFDHIQVATTVPPYSHAPGGSHIDGHGFEGADPETFTLLAGIALTDQSIPQSGNLWVWAGSHDGHSQLFHANGTRALTKAGGHTVYLQPPQQPGERRELALRRGDLVLAHFLLGHNSGGNMQPWVRRTIYFRLATPGHQERWEATFLDPLHEYEPVRRATAA
jgi:ectoine hydroxylase-related dioxygenase (phytanoyl-CoA dioxygenase family)